MRAGIEDDGFRSGNPKLRLEDMDRDHVWASVIYGPLAIGLSIREPELQRALRPAFVHVLPTEQASASEDGAADQRDQDRQRGPRRNRQRRHFEKPGEWSCWGQNRQGCGPRTARTEGGGQPSH